MVYEPAHAQLLLVGSAAAGVAAMLNRPITVTRTMYAYQNAFNEKAHAHILFRFVCCFTWSLITSKLIQIESQIKTHRQFGSVLLNTAAFPLQTSRVSK